MRWSRWSTAVCKRRCRHATRDQSDQAIIQALALDRQSRSRSCPSRRRGQVRVRARTLNIEHCGFDAVNIGSSDMLNEARSATTPRTMPVDTR